MLICDTRLSHRHAFAMFTLPYARKLIGISLAVCSLPIALVNSMPPLIYIRGKPIHFGNEVWSLDKHQNYIVNLEIYQGKAVGSNN